MAPIPSGGTVAVTGAAGFIGGWVVRGLLDRGYRVRACVRRTDDPERTGFLTALPGHASGRLTLHAADLDHDGCFDDIFRGCHGVCHVSHVSDYDDADYVRRVCDHVIASINGSDSVNRVVVTSSIAAVMSEVDLQEYVRRPVFYEDRYPDESNPRRSAQKGQGYSIGKVIAERAFSDAAAEHGGWDAINCCPGDNVGPIQAAHQRGRVAWQHQIAMMLEGTCPQNWAYRPWMTVDVRDCADAHIGLLESVDVANGERYIACSTEQRPVEEVCRSIARLLPELDFTPPPASDSFPDKVRAREAEMRAIWAGCEIRNDRIRRVTPVRFRPLDESIRDCVESLLSVGGVAIAR